MNITADEIEMARDEYVRADQRASDQPTRRNLDARAQALHRLERIQPRTDGPTHIGNIAAELEKLGQRMQERAAQEEGGLACAEARAKLAAAPARVEAIGHALEGRRACREAGARDKCVFARAPWCPWNLYEGHLEAVRVNLGELSRIKGGDEGERGELLQHFGLHPSRPKRALDPHDTFRLARVVAARRKARIEPSARGTVDSAGRALVRMELPANASAIELTGSERFVTFTGPAGLGKTLAAEFCIAVLGGMVLLSTEIDQLDGPRKDEHLRQRSLAAPCLVIDQFGRGARRETVEWLIVERDRRAVLTLLTANVVEHLKFRKLVLGEYGEAVWDRITGNGVVASFIGESLRGG